MHSNAVSPRLTDRNDAEVAKITHRTDNWWVCCRSHSDNPGMCTRISSVKVAGYRIEMDVRETQYPQMAAARGPATE